MGQTALRYVGSDQDRGDRPSKVVEKSITFLNAVLLLLMAEASAIQDFASSLFGLDLIGILLILAP